ncbi:hypothetical protein L7F22_041901 [Adiantum nelumboides]|nr:hypothetical protein [Adiantum nelumboides]
MGRTTDVLRKGFRAARCLTSLKLATSRIKIMRNKRIISAKQMRGEIAQLIKSGQDAHVYITKVDALIKQENMVAVYDILDQYCHAVMSRFPAVELQKTCPADMKEPIASIIYATPRCIELTELAAIKDAFVAKYGKEFAAAASELRPNCGVNTRVIELLSIRPATGDMKIKLMQEICKEHNVDWKPKEALAGPAGATGHGEAKVEPMQATGNALGMGEAGPSKLTPPKGVSKHGASYKSGLAEAVVSVATSSKISDPKQGSISDGDVAKGKPSISESAKGFMGTAPSTMKSAKVAVLGAEDASKVDDKKLSTDEEEDARRLQARILQSLKGGSFHDLEEIEAEANAVDFEKSTDADDQVAPSDSDSDSFVSVEEGRFEDDGESSSHGVASRKESFRDNPSEGFTEGDSIHSSLSKSSSHGVASRKESFRDNSSEGFTEGDLIYSSLSKRLLNSSQQDIYSRASSKNSAGAMDIHEVMLASSNVSRLPSETSHEDMLSKVNSKTLIAEATLEKARTDSFSMGKLVEAQYVGLEENTMIMGKLVEAQYVGLQENSMISKSEDKVFSVYHRKNSTVEETIEDEDRKDRLNMGKPVELQSVEELPEDRNPNEKNAEEFFIETCDKEGLPRNGSLENKFVEATTESPVEWKISETDSAEARKTAEGLDDERCLHSEGAIEITPSNETTDIEVVTNSTGKCFLDASEVELIVDKKSRLLPSEIIRDQSGFEGGFNKEMSPAAGEEAYLSNEKLPGHVCDDASSVSGEQPHPTFENALTLGGGELGSLPALPKCTEKLVATPSSSAFATLENGQDFTAAAKAIAAEAARLAVLDYAKRLAESGSIPLNLGELSKLGIAFEENKGGPQLMKTSIVEGRSQFTSSTALGHARDGESYETDIIKEEIVFKAEPSLTHDKVLRSDYLDANEMCVNNEKVKPSVVDDAVDVERSDFHASTTTFEHEGKLQEAVKEDEDINPFATSVATTTDKEMSFPFSKLDDEKASWVDMTQPVQTSKVGIVGHDDHLDVFFRRKTDPMFDAERYTYPNLRPSFMEGSISYDGFGVKKGSLQENLFSKSLFDTHAEVQCVKESSEFLKSPVFDKGDGGSFSSPVFDEGPEPYDAVYPSDDGVDKSRVYSATADKRGSQSPVSIKSPVIFDPEPEPCFDNVADEEELSTKERKESSSQGQLKWQSKKYVESAEHDVTGNQPSFNPSDTSSSVAGNPLSRRSRRRPDLSNDNKHLGDTTSQLASRNSLLQQRENESDWKGGVNVGKKNSLGKQQVRPDVSRSNAKSQRPSDPPTWVSSQGDSSEDDWESIPTKSSSTRLTKSPTKLNNRRRVNSEDHYFPGNNLEGGSAGTGRKTHKSPDRMTRQQPKIHGYVGVEEDPVGYNVSYKMPKASKGHQHDMVEDRIEDLEGRYKLSSPGSDLSRRTSAGSGFKSHLQQHHQMQKSALRSGYKHYEEDEGESSRTRLMSNRLHSENYMEEEERYLVSRYKPMVQDDVPLDYGRSNKSRVSNQPYLHMDVEDNEQQHPRQEEPGVGDESLRTSRPMSNRQQWKKKYIEEDKPDLVSRYKPTGLDHEPSDYGSDIRQSDNQIKSSPLRRPPSRQQEKKRSEVVSESVVRHDTPIVTDDRWLGCQEEEKKQIFSQKPSQQKQGPQQNQNWPTDSDGYDRDSCGKRQSPGSWQEKKILKDKQQSISGRWQKLTTAEEEAHEVGEKQHLPSLSYKNHHKQNKDLHSFDEPCELQEEKQGEKFTSSLEGQQEQVQQVSRLSESPSYSRKQDFRLEDNTSTSDQKELERLVGGTSAHKERWPQEEGVYEQQEKTRFEAKPLDRWHQSRTEEKGTTGDQDKLDTKMQLSTQQPSQPIPLLLESSISDPIVLATIPPPVKKLSIPSPVKLESSSSAPSPSKPCEVQVPKQPKKPPNLDDLAANFEALVRARKGE